jgi:hypothetical protein
LEINGESIYGAEAGPNHDDIRLWGGVMTQKPDKLYLHVFNWPSDRKVFVEGMKGHIVQKVYLLRDSNKNPLSFDAYDRSLMIHIPKAALNLYDNVLVVRIKDNTSLYSS